MQVNVIIEINLKNKTFIVLSKNKKAINFFKTFKNKIIKQLKDLQKYAHGGIIGEKLIIRYNTFNNKYKVLQDYFLFISDEKKYIKQDLDENYVIF